MGGDINNEIVKLNLDVSIHTSTWEVTDYECFNRWLNGVSIHTSTWEVT